MAGAPRDGIAVSVEEARAFYSETLSTYCLGESAPYCEGFLFQLPKRNGGDPDSPVEPGPKAKEVTKQVEEFLRANRRS